MVYQALGLELTALLNCTMAYSPPRIRDEEIMEARFLKGNVDNTL